MSNDPKNCRPLRTEWVPSAYCDDNANERKLASTEISIVNGFAKSALKKKLIKKMPHPSPLLKERGLK